MMISYLCMFTPLRLPAITHDDMAHLTHLIHLGLVAFPLQIDQFPYALLPEDVVAAAIRSSNPNI